MSNEFKKITSPNETRYVLESASGGGTSAGGIASVSSPMGGVRKRGDNLIAQEDTTTNNGDILVKLANVVQSVKTPEQLVAATKYANLVFNKLNAEIKRNKGFGGYGDSLKLLNQIRSDLKAKGVELQANANSDSIGMSQKIRDTQRMAGVNEWEGPKSPEIIFRNRAPKQPESTITPGFRYDIDHLKELKADYARKLERYKSLGGNNWQYADREQNLSPGEREARGLASELPQLRARIEKAEKYKEQNPGEFNRKGAAEGLTYAQKHSSWSVQSPKKNEFNTPYKLDQEKEARAHAERIGGKLVKVDQHGHAIRAKKGVAEGVVYNTLNIDNQNLINQKAKTKADGIYTFRGIMFRVRAGRVTHYASEGSIIIPAGHFNTVAGSYSTRDEAKAKLKSIKEGVAEGYILKKTNVNKYVEPGDPEDYTDDMKVKDTDYEIINNKTGQVVGVASWTTNDYFGPGALKITMKNGATRWLDIWERERGNPQSAFNRFVKDPKTAKKYKEQGVEEGSTKPLSLQQLATISDEALDNAYHYGRSSPGNTFGWQANLKSAAFAKQMIDKGVTDIEAISDAIHKGWNETAKAFVQNPDQFDDTAKLQAAGKLEAKVQQRAQLMKQNYAQLPEEEKEKDRVVARALLQAIRGQQDVEEGVFDKHGFIGKIKRGVEADRRSGEEWKKAAAADAAGDKAGASKHFKRHVKLHNLTSPNQWQKASDNPDQNAESSSVKETAPKGWEKTVKGMKKHKEIDNPWALANWMKKKGYKSQKEDHSDMGKGFGINGYHTATAQRVRPGAGADDAVHEDAYIAELFDKLAGSVSKKKNRE